MEDPSGFIPSLLRFGNSLHAAGVEDPTRLDECVNSWVGDNKGTSPQLESLMNLDFFKLSEEEFGIFRVGFAIRAFMALRPDIPALRRMMDRVLPDPMPSACDFSKFVPIARLFASKVLHAKAQSVVDILFSRCVSVIRTLDTRKWRLPSQEEVPERSPFSMPPMFAISILLELTPDKVEPVSDAYWDSVCALCPCLVGLLSLSQSVHAVRSVDEWSDIEVNILRRLIPAFAEGLYKAASSVEVAKETLEQFIHGLWAPLSLIMPDDMLWSYSCSLLGPDAGDAVCLREALLRPVVVKTRRQFERKEPQRCDGWANEGIGLLCRTSDRFRDHIPEGEFEGRLCSAIRRGLRSIDGLQKKQALYLLKKMLAPALQNEPKAETTKYRKKAGKKKSKSSSAPVPDSEASTSHSDRIINLQRRGWNAYLAILDTLNEFSVHLFKNIVERLPSVWEATEVANDPVAKQYAKDAGCPVLDMAWVCVLLERALVHENASVTSLAVETFLCIDPSAYPNTFAHPVATEFVAGPFLAAMDATSHYRDVASCADAMKGKVATHLTKFVAEVLRLRRSKEDRFASFQLMARGFFSRHFSRPAQTAILCVLTSEDVWAVMSSDSDPSSALSGLALDNLRAFLNERVSVQSTVCCRAASYRASLLLVTRYACGAVAVAGENSKKGEETKEENVKGERAMGTDECGSGDVGRFCAVMAQFPKALLATHHNTILRSLGNGTHVLHAYVASKLQEFWTREIASSEETNKMSHVISQLSPIWQRTAATLAKSLPFVQCETTSHSLLSHESLLEQVKNAARVLSHTGAEHEGSECEGREHVLLKIMTTFSFVLRHSPSRNWQERRMGKVASAALAEIVPSAKQWIDDALVDMSESNCERASLSLSFISAVLQFAPLEPENPAAIALGSLFRDQLRHLNDIAKALECGGNAGLMCLTAVRIVHAACEVQVATVGREEIPIRGELVDSWKTVATILPQMDIDPQQVKAYIPDTCGSCSRGSLSIAPSFETVKWTTIARAFDILSTLKIELTRDSTWTSHLQRCIRYTVSLLEGVGPTYGVPVLRALSSMFDFTMPLLPNHNIKACGDGSSNLVGGDDGEDGGDGACFFVWNNEFLSTLTDGVTTLFRDQSRASVELVAAASHVLSHASLFCQTHLHGTTEEPGPLRVSLHELLKIGEFRPRLMCGFALSWIRRWRDFPVVLPSYVSEIAALCVYGSDFREHSEIIDRIDLLKEGITNEVGPTFTGLHSDIAVRVLVNNFITQLVAAVAPPGTPGRTDSEPVILRTDADRNAVKEFLRDLVPKLLFYKIPPAPKGYNSGTNAHLIRLRLCQTLCLTAPAVQEDTISTEALCKPLLEHQTPSVRQFWEAFFTVYLVRFPHKAVAFLSKGLLEYNARPQMIHSFLFIGTSFLLYAEPTPVRDEAFKSLFPLLATWVHSFHRLVRGMAQLCFLKLRAKFGPGGPEENRIRQVLPHWEHHWALLDTVGEYLEKNRDCEKMVGWCMPVFDAFDPLKVPTLNYIYLPTLDNDSTIESEWCPPSLTERLRSAMHSPLEVGETTEKPLQSTGDTDVDAIAETLGTENVAVDFQMKIIPWDDIELDNTSFRKQLKSSFNGDGIVVVASLIDKIPNLGGLARTCEIFQASELVLPSRDVMEKSIFQSTSVTAEHWIHVDECAPENLAEYLEGRRADGYRLVGLEQTAQSTSIADFKFQPKTVLVLGNELQGIPVEIIRLMDTCIEIPQLGIIRSLNVHVSGAILLWEYARQCLLPHKS